MNNANFKKIYRALKILHLTACIIQIAFAPTVLCPPLTFSVNRDLHSDILLWSKLLWTTYSNMERTGELLLTYSQQSACASSDDSTGQFMKKIHWNIETHSPNITWNYSRLEKSTSVELGIEPGTPWSVDRDVITEPSGLDK